MGLPSRHVLMHERLPLLGPSAISVKSTPVWSYQQGLVLSGDSLELYRDVLGLVGGYQVPQKYLEVCSTSVVYTTVWCVSFTVCLSRFVCL